MSDEKAISKIRAIFAEELAGHEVLANNSKWLNFTTVRNRSWRHGNIVLLGDAAHTAHFSIGSGTKLAMEDSLALAACLHEHQDLETALAAYETERRPVVESTQRAAQASLEWFERIGQYKGQEPTQFAFNLLTRSRRITQENLRLRDPEFAGAVDRHFADSQGLPDVAPAMFQPYRIGGLELKNRIIVSPMDMYSATDGVPGNFHLVHLGSKALGGAGLVMTEMVCVSPEGRITPGCSGLYTDEQRTAGRPSSTLSTNVRRQKSASQIGHSGRKGSTRLMWEGIDEPLETGNWEPVGPSALPYGAGEPGAAGNRQGRNGPGQGRLRRRCPPRRAKPASTCSRSTPRTDTCCPPSFRQSPTSAPTSTAAAWRTGCASRWRSSTQSAPPGLRTSR